MKRTFTWAGELERPRLSKSEYRFYAHAADFGIRSGIIIPVKTANGSISMFTAASDKREIDLKREIDPVAAVSAVAQLHTRITFLRATSSVKDLSYLDAKEATYLRWIAVGKTMEEVADIEGVKYSGQSPCGAGSLPVRQSVLSPLRTKPEATVHDSRFRCRSVGPQVLVRRR